MGDLSKVQRDDDEDVQIWATFGALRRLWLGPAASKDLDDGVDDLRKALFFSTQNTKSHECPSSSNDRETYNDDQLRANIVFGQSDETNPFAEALLSLHLISVRQGLVSTY